jgi:lipopolysaccharide transport system ATP-binding protein
MIALRTENLGKAYRLYRRPIDSLKELILRRDYAETFWALRDVTVEVEKGSSLGIVGDNGAGKSTLLRLLAGSLAPTTGRIERTGRVATMLTLGGGFHPDLSGIDNIRIGCAVVGLSPDDTDALIPRIIDFSELGEFVHRPVRTYSSGMYLRLGFSVATAVDPDVLVVDEHLSVGDIHFRLKCKRRIMNLRSDGCTIILCSHDLHSVSEVCDQALWLTHGRPRMYEDALAVVEQYQDSSRRSDAGAPIETKTARRVLTSNYLKDVSLGGDVVGGEIRSGGVFRVRVTASLSQTAAREGMSVAVVINRADGLKCYGTSTKVDGVTDRLSPIGEDNFAVTFVIDALPLLAGRYSLVVALQDVSSPHTFDWLANVASFTVKDDGRDGGVTRMAHRWERPD